MGGIALGLTDIEAIALGTTEVLAVSHGSAEVWPVPSGAFDPMSIGWHAAFYADDITGLANGDPVATWQDSSGNARHATQATAAKRPVYRPVVAALNGQAAVQWDTVDDVLVSAFADVPQPNEIVIIGTVSPLLNRVLTDGRPGSSASNRNFIGTEIDSAFYRYYAGSSVRSSTLADGAGHMLRGVFNGSSGSSINLDGVSIVTGNPGAAAAGGLSIGADNTGARQTGGQFAFVGIKATPLTTAERADLLAWSQSKYGTP